MTTQRSRMARTTVVASLSATTTHWESRVPKSTRWRKRPRPDSSARSSATVSLNAVGRGRVTTERAGRGRRDRQVGHAAVTWRATAAHREEVRPPARRRLRRRSAPGWAYMR